MIARSLEFLHCPQSQYQVGQHSVQWVIYQEEKCSKDEQQYNIL